MDFEITEEMKRDLAQADDCSKRNLGSYDLDGMFSEFTDKFDKRKFGKLECSFCGHRFNPYYHKTLKAGEWNWEWVGCDHKEPRSHCEIPCPKCKQQLYFTQLVGQ